MSLVSVRVYVGFILGEKGGDRGLLSFEIYEGT